MLRARSATRLSRAVPPPPADSEPLECMDEVTVPGEEVIALGRDATTIAQMFGIISADGETSCSPTVPGTGVPVPSAGAAEPQVTVVTCRLDDDEDVTCTIAISVLPPGGARPCQPAARCCHCTVPPRIGE